MEIIGKEIERIGNDWLTKRAFGILLAAQDDDQLRASICNELISHFSPLRKLKKTFRGELFLQMVDQYENMLINSRLPHENVRCIFLFAAYIVDHYWGLNGNTHYAVEGVKVSTISHIIDGEGANQASKHKFMDNLNVRDYIRTPAIFRAS